MERKVKGRIKTLDIKNKTITIEFTETVKLYDTEYIVNYNGSLLELNNYRNKKFNVSKTNGSQININLLYQFYKEKELILFGIKNGKKNNYKIKNMELIDE